MTKTLTCSCTSLNTHTLVPVRVHERQAIGWKEVPLILVPTLVNMRIYGFRNATKDEPPCHKPVNGQSNQQTDKQTNKPRSYL